MTNFVSVGENIHCTRVYKVGGNFVRRIDADNYAISYGAEGNTRQLPIPNTFKDTAEWEDGKIKHCAVAIWQANYGETAARSSGVDYIQNAAMRQEAAGATFLDINVDEFSTDVEERSELMKWAVRTVQEAVTIPVSIDSSDTRILRAGLEAADKTRSRPMVNSVSLERTDAIDVAAEFGSVVIASAAGKTDLPKTTAGRLDNLRSLASKLEKAGIQGPSLHIDPLVFPIAIDGNNGTSFLESVTAIRAEYGPDIHIVAGLSNISFGMPNRKLINQVFASLAVDAGADGGIVDPLQVNTIILNNIDTASSSYKLARKLITGEDEFGMDYITACREGTI